MKDFFAFLDRATVPVTAVEASAQRLVEAGFVELDMAEEWSVEEGGRYLVRPYPTMLVAVSIGRKRSMTDGFRILGAHTDSPGFRLKPEPEMTAEGYLKLNVETYGSPILSSWMDRPLSMAGRVALRSEKTLHPRMRTLDLGKPLFTIPNLAIHMNRDVNKGVELKKQKDMLPLAGLLGKPGEEEGRIRKLLARALDVDPYEILDYDMGLYVVEKPVLLGLEEEFVSAPRIDDLAMVYAITRAMAETVHDHGINVALFMDHEEVGSGSKAGADSNLPALVLQRFSLMLNRTPSQYQRMLAQSFLISADGAHGVHPNAPEKADPVHKPLLNRGVVLKGSASQSYAGDPETGGAFRQLCGLAGVEHQLFVNHSDSPGGKTIGPLMARHLPVPTVDMGIPMLAMHSARELMGRKDLEDSIRLFSAFYSH
ncbi:M18 family aminopeptidase [Anaerotalea alkaliphila]|uniref:M18 family aminopeptidase n=1 Tax=Anaerotalea alkaliphila TaxID=2662126 RepID=A0A7X5KLC0_9FIRM|nr:M18 family aminopeptidase [Anaerotalea alkaliphila]NDL66676.1 M18 family aminopeptidase [Anaerotalea alkaliphila]